MAGDNETRTSLFISSIANNGGVSDSGDSMDIQECIGIIDDSDNYHNKKERNKQQPQQHQEVQGQQQQQHYSQQVYQEIHDKIHNVKNVALECIISYQEERLGFKTTDPLSSIYSSPQTFMGRINRILDKDFYTFVIDLSLLTKSLDELFKYCQHYEKVSKGFDYKGDTINNFCIDIIGGSDTTANSLKLGSGMNNNKNIKKKKIVKKL